ncbi:MAG: hypothetical protein AAFR59_14395 [Bacteroidota bacterium]
MNKHVVIFSSLLLLFLSSCGLFEGPRTCTLELVMVTVEVTGDSLDQTYTIWSGTQDTVERSTAPINENAYLVLDDRYQPSLQNEVREFRFIGLKGGSILVDELFTIEADECHISKVSGVDQVAL